MLVGVELLGVDVDVDVGMDVEAKAEARASVGVGAEAAAEAEAFMLARPVPNPIRAMRAIPNCMALVFTVKLPCACYPLSQITAHRVAGVWQSGKKVLAT